MMTLTQYYLVKLAEEASEVAQIALKCAHFGVSEVQPGQSLTNAQRCYAELNDLLAMVHQLGKASGGEFYFSQDGFAMANKIAKVDRYLAYSQSLGLVELNAEAQS
ncbi:hypothetical protein NDK50_08045 [Paraburkholderia bryophila]|uniref:hypothetical protein n=1 Tax=Paraburkholderia bryophila TaxID=420952 RepID=UPI00234B003C|nr:hypothetical protein [Paraburkholderia bryophila]WCM21387.1 hypothetical protein NDK50_08045 [Paraburkholderia bryophila]